MKTKLPPLYTWATTIVDPSEYDIEKQMKEAVKIANKDMQSFIPMDIGKMVGLYLAWKEQKETIETMLKHQKISNRME